MGSVLGKSHNDKVNAALADLPAMISSNGKAIAKDYADGDRLYLVVRPNGAELTGGSRSWVFKFTWCEPGEKRGALKKIGLGPYPEVNLSAARAAADLANKGLAQDPPAMPRGYGYVDPAERQANKTLAEHAEEFITETRLPGITADAAGKWLATIAMIQASKVGKKKVRDVTVADIKAMLLPTWLEFSCAARIRRMHLAAIFDSAEQLELRAKLTNPATEEALKGLLPPQPELGTIMGPRKALPHEDMPGFYDEMSRRQVSSRALGGQIITWASLALVLTATRTKEVRQMQWDQINLERRRWLIPGKVMKNKLPADIPLSFAMMELLKTMDAWRQANNYTGPFVFPGEGKTGMIGKTALIDAIYDLGYDATAHGHRAVFKSWCQTETVHQDETSEMCLHHIVGDKARDAYARSDMWEKRRDALECWALFVQGKPVPEQFMKPKIAQGWDAWNIAAG